MLHLVINTVPKSHQRYPTCGDYQIDLGPRTRGDYGLFGWINVAKFESPLGWKYELLIAVHELIEAGLCRAHHIPDSVIDRFDFKFEGEGEPGDDPKSPYYKQHQIATGIERILAAELGVDWGLYEKSVDSYCEDLARHFEESGRKPGEPELEPAEVPGDTT